MIGDRAVVVVILWRQSTLRDQLREKFAMMHDLIVAADLGIVVAKAVDAVGAMGDDPPRLDAIERFDIPFGKFLK